MTYYHVRITEAGERSDEVKLDLDEGTLDRQFLQPYREGTAITISGKSIPMERVERIRISASDAPSQQLVEAEKRDDARSSVAVLGGPTYEWRAARRAEDVTDQFVTGPPGEHASRQGPMAVGPARRTRESHGGLEGGRDVFVITGRDTAVTSAVIAFLRSLGLRIIEWEHAVAKTGVPNPYVGDVVEEGLRMADAAVVVVTPDDLVRLRDDLVRDDDPPAEGESGGQARPNVLYEAGFADALGRDRTIIVEVGPVKSFSDVAGRHVVRYDGSPAKRNVFAERLRIAGLDADTTGQDWLNVGDLTTALTNMADALRDSTSATADDMERRIE